MSPENYVYEGSIEHGSWVDADELRPGAKLHTSDGRTAYLLKLEIKQEPLTAYNLTVADFSTFFVTQELGQDGVWVHNGKRGGRNFGNNLTPDPNAVGPHSTFMRGPDGKISKYQEWIPNPCNPTGFDAGKRLRRYGGPHGGQPTPFIIDRGQKGARPPLPWEMPK